MKLQGGKAILPTLEGWLRNIRSLSKLATEVDELDFVLTRHISQDMLEHFFAKLRGKGGYRDTHTAQQFRYAYRAACLDRLKYTIAGQNCTSEPDGGTEEEDEQVDQDTLFTRLLQMRSRATNPEPTSSLEMLANMCKHAPRMKTETKQDHSYQEREDREQKTSAENHTIFYMAGLYSKRSIEGLNCTECTEKVLSDKISWEASTESQLATYTINKQYENVKKGLTYPSLAAVIALQAMDRKLSKIIEFMLYGDRIIHTMSRIIMDEVPGPVGCASHNHLILRYMAQVYSRTYLYETLKQKNRQVKQETKGKRKNKKYEKLAKSKVTQPEP